MKEADLHDLKPETPALTEMRFSVGAAVWNAQRTLVFPIGYINWKKSSLKKQKQTKGLVLWLHSLDSAIIERLMGPETQEEHKISEKSKKKLLIF